MYIFIPFDFNLIVFMNFSGAHDGTIIIYLFCLDGKRVLGLRNRYGNIRLNRLHVHWHLVFDNISRCKKSCVQ